MTDKNARGLVQIFTGEGKGKTTAALGTILRAAGHGFKISVIFFIKGHSSQGEYKSLASLPNVKVASFGLRQFIHKNNVINPEEKAQAQAALAAAREDITSDRFNLIVLDEINMAVYFNLLEIDDVLRLIKDKPSRLELILTGRNADKKLIAAADLVTEMVKVKHPFEKGIKARKGIEF